MLCDTGRHICFTTSSGPANSLEIFLHCMWAGRHICKFAASVQANGHVIFLCYMRAGHHICILAASVPANRHVIFCATCILADIYVTSLQAYQPTGMNIPALYVCQPTHICLQEHRFFLLHFCFSNNHVHYLR